MSFADEVAELIQERDGLASACAAAQDAASDTQQQNRCIMCTTHPLCSHEAVAVPSQGQQVAICQWLRCACDWQSCNWHVTSGLMLLCASAGLLAALQVSQNSSSMQHANHLESVHGLTLHFHLQVLPEVLATKCITKLSQCKVCSELCQKLLVSCGRPCSCLPPPSPPGCPNGGFLFALPSSLPNAAPFQCLPPSPNKVDC